jgi:hypothetical protein
MPLRGNELGRSLILLDETRTHISVFARPNLTNSQANNKNKSIR